MARPPKWKTPEELEEQIALYWKKCDEKKLQPTKGGLALHLDTTRDVLGDYEKKDEYSHAIKKAYMIIEESWVQALYTKQSVAGIIFYLKNAFSKDWRDKQEIDHTFNSIKELPNEELERIAAGSQTGAGQEGTGKENV